MFECTLAMRDRTLGACFAVGSLSGEASQDGQHVCVLWQELLVS